MFFIGEIIQQGSDYIQSRLEIDRESIKKLIDLLAAKECCLEREGNPSAFPDKQYKEKVNLIKKKFFSETEGEDDLAWELYKELLLEIGEKK